MSPLQEFLALLLGSESEARRKEEEARMQAEDILALARQDFQREREARLEAVRDQAKAIIEASGKTTEAEIRQIQSLEEQESEGMAGRFQAHSRGVIDALIEETAAGFIRKGIR